MTIIEELAGWASSLRLDAVPGEVRALCRAQRRSVLAAIAASTGDDAARRVLAGLGQWAADGPAPLLGTDRLVRVEDALYGAAVLSIALDFDDYLCFAHSGHSAVLVPVLLATETGADGAGQLRAQVAANEVEARLGGACLIGPLNGQMWSFVHAAGAALAAGLLLGLDQGRLAHALALALYQAPRPTVPGFMGPDSKLLTAAEPAGMGLRAARLAVAGVNGPLDVLEHRRGFLAAFADAPLRGMLTGLGEGWATRTLCIKPYPGCAYIDTAVDAMVEMGPPAPGEVEHVTVDAAAVTNAMEALSAQGHPTTRSAPPTPVTVSFSVRWSLAVLLLAGELGPDQVNARWLDAHYDELAPLANRIELRHDVALSSTSAEQFGRLLPPGTLLRESGAAGLWHGLRQLREYRPAGRPGFGQLAQSMRQLAGSLPLRTARPVGRAGITGRFFDPCALEKFAMTFPARVRVRLRDGTQREARVDVPRGGAGHAEGPEVISQEKLAAWGPRLWGEQGTAALAKAVDADADHIAHLLAEGDGGAR